MSLMACQEFSPHVNCMYISIWQKQLYYSNDISLNTSLIKDRKRLIHEKHLQLENNEG